MKNSYDELSDGLKQSINNTQKHIEYMKASKSEDEKRIAEFLVYLSINIDAFKELYKDETNLDKLKVLEKDINRKTHYTFSKYYIDPRVKSFLSRNGFFDRTTFLIIDFILCNLIACIIASIVLIYTNIDLVFLIIGCLSFGLLLHLTIETFNNINFYRIKKK